MMVKAKILLVEDEEALGKIVKDSLETRGFEVVHIIDGSLAYGVYLEQKPSIIVLDVMLPSENGINISTKIRREDSYTPILFLSAKTMPKDVLNGYLAGGNDYLKKPFDMEELIIRIKVLLNQNRLYENDKPKLNIVNIGNYTFDMKQCLLNYQGKSRRLTARENEVLSTLYQNKDQLIARKDFLIKVWGDDDFFSSRSLDVFITKLRKYLKEDPMVQIINHRGFGYRLVF